MVRDLLNIRTLPDDDIHYLLSLGQEHRDAREEGRETKLDPRSVGLLFFESSTRTRVSFEQACRYLGYQPVNFSGEGSSMSKGETLKDTILTLKNTCLDMLVMRHKASGSPLLAKEFFGGPVINAGDGEHEHPTQALADALTILQHKPSIEGLKVAIVGDVLHSRVARSNAWLLSKLGAEIRFVGPATLMPPVAHRLPGAVHYDLKSGIADADVVMCLRLQRERIQGPLISSISEYRRQYQVSRNSLRAAKPDAIIMHPGPMNRGIELDDTTADGPNSVVLEQVKNGVFVRMAVLQWAMGDDRGAA